LFFALTGRHPIAQGKANAPCARLSAPNGATSHSPGQSERAALGFNANYRNALKGR
jgi:hypothetical protein